MVRRITPSRIESDNDQVVISGSADRRRGEGEKEGIAEQRGGAGAAALLREKAKNAGITGNLTINMTFRHLIFLFIYLCFSIFFFFFLFSLFALILLLYVGPSEPRPLSTLPSPQITNEYPGA